MGRPVAPLDHHRPGGVLAQQRIEDLVGAGVGLAPHAEVAGHRLADQHVGVGIGGQRQADRGGGERLRRQLQLAREPRPQRARDRRERGAAADQVDAAQLARVVRIDAAVAQPGEQPVDLRQRGVDQRLGPRVQRGDVERDRLAVAEVEQELARGRRQRLLGQPGPLEGRRGGLDPGGVEEQLVEVVAAEPGQAGRGDQLEVPALQRHRRGVEGAAAEVVDHDVLLGALAAELEVAVGEVEGARGRLVEQAERREARAAQRLERQPALPRRRVGRHRRHHLERCVGIEVERAAFAQRRAQLDEERGRQPERGDARQPRHRRVGRQRADRPLDRSDRVGGRTVGQRPRRRPAHDQRAVLPRRDAGHVVAELAVVVEHRQRVPAVLHRRHHRPRGPKVDPEPHAPTMPQPRAGRDFSAAGGGPTSTSPEPPRKHERPGRGPEARIDTSSRQLSASP